ncbi:MAG: hypothetical protein R3338_13230, partial [Thermoanaerobaculia bacterium]|nr:hypothetical protein [Thermoanaerobaculia bacterium]
MRHLIVATTFILLLPLSVSRADQPENADDPNERLVLEMIDAVNARDLDALDAIVSRDLVRHSAATPDVDVRSLDDFKSFL